MKRLIYSFGILLILIGLTGCAGVYYSVPVKTNISNENKYFIATIKPTNPSMVAGYSAFILNIKNKTDKDLEVDWNKTYYIKNGQSKGTFMFEGIIFRDRNQPKAPDVVFANSEFSKLIFPNNYVHYDKYGWTHWGTGTGKQGVYLTINVDGKAVKQRIIIDVKEGKQK